MSKLKYFAMVVGMVCFLGATSEDKSCPLGQVWGGVKCEYLNICPDGTPLLQGEICRRPQGPYLPPPPPPPAGCQRIVVFSGGAKSLKSRTVLLSGGETVPLFDKYLARASESSIEVDLENLTIIWFDQKKGRISLEGRKKTMAEMLRGDTYKQIWRRRLKGNSARAVKDAEIQARSLRADLICG